MEQAVDQSPVIPRARRDGVVFAIATRADDAEIRRLLRENPMPGEVRISLEREPDASLAAAIEGDPHHTIVARDPHIGRLIALGSVSVRNVYLNGEPVRAGYLSQLRLDHRYRSRAAILMGGYRFFREIHATLDVKLYLTSIASDNTRARRLLERGLPGMPTYRRLGCLNTLLIESSGKPSKPPSGSHVRRGTTNDLPQILDCLERNRRRYHFSPVWRETDLIERMRSHEHAFILSIRHDRVVGCLAVWNQSEYKQAVIRGYAPRLLRWRKWIDFAVHFTSIPRLPPVGAVLDMKYLSHVAIDHNDPLVFADLLACACREGDGYFVLGLSECHPLLQAIPRGLRRRTYRTNLYAVHWDDGRADADSLDERPTWPEVALL